MVGRILIVSILGSMGVWGTTRGHWEDTSSNSSSLSVSFVLSDTVILSSDPVLYKLLLRNQTRSLIYIAKPPGEGFTHFLDHRRPPSKKWVQVAELSAATMGAVEGERTLAGEQTFATYGKFFTNVERKAIFSLPGDYEVRIRVKCLLGDFTTEAQTVHVGERPLAEVEAITEHANVLREYIDFFRFPDPPEKKFAKLRQKVHAGSIDRTLRMFEGLSEFMKTKTVAGEKCTSRDAFSKLSNGLDEVRHDQLAMAFIWNALESRQWKDAAEILPELAEETDWRAEFERALQAAARRELRKNRTP